MTSKTYKVWDVREHAIPCPFRYSQGRKRPSKPCGGYVATVWVPVFWKPSGPDYGHYHLTCTKAGQHGSPRFGLAMPGEPSDDPLKYWPGELPEPIRAIIRESECEEVER